MKCADLWRPARVEWTHFLWVILILSHRGKGNRLWRVIDPEVEVAKLSWDMGLNFHTSALYPYSVIASMSKVENCCSHWSFRLYPHKNYGIHEVKGLKSMSRSWYSVLWEKELSETISCFVVYFKLPSKTHFDTEKL